MGEPDAVLALSGEEPLPEVGDVELGIPILEPVDGATLGFDRALLRFVDDCVDGLATLEPGVLAADDVCEGWEPTELPDGAEGEVPLDDSTPLDTVCEVELGKPILEAVDGALLGFVDDCADGLAPLEPGGLAADDACEGSEPTELPDGADGDVVLEEPTPLDTGLDEPTATELAFWLDVGEPGLLPTCDDNPEPLPGLAELICEGWDALDASLGEVPELPDANSLLPPLADGVELAADWLGLALLARLGDRDDASLGAEELPMELARLEIFPELGCVDSPELVVEGGDDGVLDAPELESIELADDGVCDDGWLSRLEAWLDGSDDLPEPDDPDPSDGALDVSLDSEDSLRTDESPEMLDWLSDEVDWLDGLADESDADDPDDGERELRDWADSLLSDDGGADDCRDEPALFEPDDADGELPDGDEPLSDLLDWDDGLLESLDRDDRLSDEPDELLGELLRPELLSLLDDERSEELRLDEESPLATELRRLLVELSCDELRFELEPLLTDESLEELGDDRDDSLTLENDLLDP